MEDEVYEEVEPEEDSDEDDESMEQPPKEANKGNDEEEEETEPPEDGLMSTGLKTPGEGLMTPSGISTGLVSAGLETPDMIELRKRKSQIESEMDASGEAQALYQILPEKSQSVGGSMMGSSKVYDLSSAKKVDAGGMILTGTGVDLALNPDELDMSSDVLQSRYDQQLKQKNGDNEDGEDLGDLAADHVKSLSKKRKSKQPAPPTSNTPSGSSSEKDKNKKYKEFKF